MKFKKFISLVLTCIMLLSVFASVFSASAATACPTVYVQGQGSWIYSADGKLLYNGRVPIPDGYIEDNIKGCLGSFAMGFITGDFTKWHDDFMAVWEPIYADIRLDKNGENSNGTYDSFSWSPASLTPNYTFGSYHYQPDWRLDPFENAEDLKNMIEAIKAKTGSSKVNIVSRCEGTNVVMAYLAAYGFDSVNCLTLYIASVYGVDMIGATFAGKIRLYPEELANLYYDKGSEYITDPAICEIIDEVLEWAVDSYGFEEACALFESMLGDLYEDALYDAILCSYGSFPGIWSLVGPQYYDEARRVCFTGREEEYAGLIEKIDRYDTAVRQRADDILLEAQESGVKVQIIAKYLEGGLKVPIGEETFNLTDDAISLCYSSFGATCSRADELLDEAYLADIDSEFISPDKRIDASTCVLPDRTWFIYNSPHNDFSASIDTLMAKFLECDGNMTVDSFEAFPRYIYKDAETNTIRPMQEGDAKFELRKEPGLIDMFKRLINSFRRFFALVKKLISFVQGGNA